MSLQVFQPSLKAPTQSGSSLCRGSSECKKFGKVGKTFLTEEQKRYRGWRKKSTQRKFHVPLRTLPLANERHIYRLIIKREFIFADKNLQTQSLLESHIFIDHISRQFFLWRWVFFLFVSFDFVKSNGCDRIIRTI